ncbi:MAG: GNAT family N-acetyltransferase [Polyangia bacterium]
MTELFAASERLHAALHPVYFRADGRLDPRLVDAIEGPSHERALFVIERERRVMGFVHVELLEPRARDRARLGRRGHVDTLVVDPAMRRAGCGRALIDAAAAWARERGALELLLTVWAGNREAERFYEQLGLVAVSRVMKLSL